ncbi:hypothetical protein GCM10009839_23830 [Catenulispora yoronensis]|uniref:Uncharacterized protein n=1 Tax=Catenulispora yoronensis TaxID=450799 RepID=A0ABN2TZC0_9ACTN
MTPTQAAGTTAIAGQSSSCGTVAQVANAAHAQSRSTRTTVPVLRPYLARGRATGARTTRLPTSEPTAMLNPPTESLTAPPDAKRPAP